MESNRRFLYLTVLLLLPIIFSGFIPRESDPVMPQDLPDEFCISSEEYRLYKLINDFRKENDLAVIPISSSLSYVAKIHVRDLADNRPDTSYCNLNSWSANGPWTSCCHSKYKPEPECILNKPRELTQYDGEGHELCYWDSEGADPDTVFEFWATIEQAEDMILNREKWALYGWNSMGVGIYKGYASVWLGELVDSEPEPTICVKDSDKEMEIPREDKDNTVVPSPTGRYYIIFGSFQDIETARQERKKFESQGFYKAKILIKNNNFRVSLSDHPSMEEAQEARSRMAEKYQKAWILKF
jgi:hypothetical protein